MIKETLTKEIDLYIVGWLNMGFENDMLLMVADNCFKSTIRTLEGVTSHKLELVAATIRAFHFFLHSFTL